MSIIYDALKKVECSAAAETKPRLKAKISKPRKIGLAAAYLLAAGLGVMLGNFIFSVLISPSTPARDAPAKQAMQEPPKAAAPLAPAGLALEQAPPAKVSGAPNLVLNGIFFSRDEGYALINNQIVKEGDEVDGATVKEINIDEVELAALGSTIKLSCRAK
ncbi:MAG: hypothetical protein A3G38_03065 [Omnitrophica WOR_2 bacterium RIFCSPLOWO2_12_FULL_51_8]|nr:MAG: hypothetical protein A3G38_03065 [Omnitrophica WOR_2 bacterium RIFCSPLOWO2_12_FULL_51_8]